MPFSRTRVVTDKAIRERVYLRRRASIDELINFGFKDYHCIEEELFPLSFFVFFWIVPLAWIDGDAISVTRNLRIRAYYPYLLNANENTYGHIFASGCLFGSAFDDGTILMSVNYDLDGTNEKRKYFRNVLRAVSNETLWKSHLDKVNEFERNGLMRLSHLTIEDVQAISFRSDSVQMGLSEKKT